MFVRLQHVRQTHVRRAATERRKPLHVAMARGLKNAGFETPDSDQSILSSMLNNIKVLGGGGVGEETLLQKGPSPTKHLTSPTKHCNTPVLYLQASCLCRLCRRAVILAESMPLRQTSSVVAVHS